MIDQEENSTAETLDSIADESQASELDSQSAELVDEQAGNDQSSTSPELQDSFDLPSDSPELNANQIDNEAGETNASSTAENSGVQATKKEEETITSTKSEPQIPWKAEISRFHEIINGLLAAKENYKLVAVDQKLKSSYSRNWRNESNRYFQLAVQIRRRASGSKLSGKTIV